MQENKDKELRDSEEERKLEAFAMNVVHQIGDALYEALPRDVAHKYFVTARQKTNDEVIDFVKRLHAADKRRAVEEALSWVEAHPEEWKRRLDRKALNQYIERFRFAEGKDDEPYE